jgi:hypothetical protein
MTGPADRHVGAWSAVLDFSRPALTGPAVAWLVLAENIRLARVFDRDNKNTARPSLAPDTNTKTMNKVREDLRRHRCVKLVGLGLSLPPTTLVHIWRPRLSVARSWPWQTYNDEASSSMLWRDGPAPLAMG